MLNCEVWAINVGKSLGARIKVLITTWWTDEFSTGRCLKAFDFHVGWEIPKEELRSNRIPSALEIDPSLCLLIYKMT